MATGCVQCSAPLIIPPKYHLFTCCDVDEEIVSFMGNKDQGIIGLLRLQPRIEVYKIEGYRQIK